MKVILLRDVAKIGKRFEVVQVPDGYALNKLIPLKDAEAATPVNLKRILEKQKNDSRSVASEVALLKSIHDDCLAAPLEIVMEANEQGHLFQGVRASDIVAAAKLRDIAIPVAFLKLATPIKTVGRHEVQLESGATAYSLGIEVVAKGK
jgi:large subunit ribosomal protein L9